MHCGLVELLGACTLSRLHHLLTMCKLGDHSVPSQASSTDSLIATAPTFKPCGAASLRPAHGSRATWKKRVTFQLVSTDGESTYTTPCDVDNGCNRRDDVMTSSRIVTLGGSNAMKQSRSDRIELAGEGVKDKRVDLQRGYTSMRTHRRTDSLRAADLMRLVAECDAV